MIWQFSNVTGRKRNQDKLKMMLKVVNERAKCGITTLD
jgi:hypothetical protein